MHIGELAKKAEVTPRTIRYYEELNLLGSRENKPEKKGAYEYSDNDFTRLIKIDKLKKTGLSLEEIREVIDLYFTTPTGLEGKQALLRILTVHLQETDKKIEILQQFHSELSNNIAKLKKSIRRILNTDNS